MNSQKLKTDSTGIDPTKYVLISEDIYGQDDFKPPSCWYVRDATGNRMYLKAQKRQKAQELVDLYYGLIFGQSKYTVVVDKPAQIR